MKKISRAFAAVALLCAVCFLGGEWPDDTPMNKVIECDGIALAVVFASGIYLKKTEEK